MGKNTAAARRRAISLSPEGRIVLAFDAGLRAGSQQFQVSLDARLQAEEVVVNYSRYAIGEDVSVADVQRTLTLEGAWREDIETVVGDTQLVDRLHLVDGPTYKLRLELDEAAPPTRSKKHVPCTPSNLDDWMELSEALGCLADARPTPSLRFMHVSSRRVLETRIDHNVKARTASLSYFVDGQRVHRQKLALADYKEVVAVLRGMRAVGATFAGDPPAKEGFYVDRGTGDLSAWSRDVINPQGARVQACIERIRKLPRPKDFPAWLPA